MPAEQKLYLNIKVVIAVRPEFLLALLWHLQSKQMVLSSNN